MSKPRQQNRKMAIATGLGEDALVLNRATIQDRLSALFSIEAELSAPDGNVDYRKVVGHPASLRLEIKDQQTRYYHGYVSRFVQVANQGGYARYRATIVPWPWFLTRTSDCRVFQYKKALDIAEEVCNGHMFGSEYYTFRLRESYPEKRYCVQYRETDFQFISRLLETEGIYYWFEHQANKHQLIFADSIQASQAREGYETLEYREVETGSGAAGREVITDWVVEQEVQPVGLVTKDFDFKKPSDPLLGKHEIKREHGMARFKMYEYPGEYYEPEDAERYARIRLEGLQSGHEVVAGVTTARGLAPGQVFELKKHPREDQNRKYLVTGVTMSLDAGEFASGGNGEEMFRCEFTAIPDSTPYRPPRATPKPIIQGIQTATVVGQKGAEVDPDEFGRVKVQFHWDRYGKMDATSSCWVRVSQPWAGKGYGGMNIPRIGQEVVVEFIEGDPDRPLINGRLYNAESMPHASNAGRDGKPGNTAPPNLKHAAMMTSFKSSSLGGSGGSNEITMNDEGGKETFLLKAQKDEFHNVGNDREDTVANNETRKVGNDRSREVGNNETVKIGVNREKTVGTDEKETIGSNKTIDVGANLSESVGKNMTLKVGMMKNESVGLASIENVGAAKTLTVGAAYAVTVTGAMNTAVGLAQFEEVGLTKQIVVGDSFEITCGSSKFKMESSGKITLEGTDIVIKSTGPAQLSADATLDLNGAVIDLN